MAGKSSSTTKKGKNHTGQNALSHIRFTLDYLLFLSLLFFFLVPNFFLELFSPCTNWFFRSFVVVIIVDVAHPRRHRGNTLSLDTRSQRARFERQPVLPLTIYEDVFFCLSLLKLFSHLLHLYMACRYHFHSHYCMFSGNKMFFLHLVVWLQPQLSNNY